MPYERIAKSLLDIYGDMESFHVDFYDTDTTNKIAAALEALGAKVERVAHKTSLHVTMPPQEEPQPATDS